MALLLSGCCLLLYSCSPQSKLAKRGGYILSRNSVKTDNSYLPAEEINGFIRQKPARGSLIFFRPGIWIYEQTSQGKQNGFKNWLQNAFGTQPVILDTNLARQSVNDISRYLFNKGFHNPKVSHSIRFHNLSAGVTYQISAGTPYRIAEFRYNIPDTAISNRIIADSARSLIKKGIIFDTYLLDSERDRITKKLKNDGYYDFSRSYITFLADTTLAGKEVKLTLIIHPLMIRVPGTDSLTGINHPRFFLRNIYIMPDPVTGELIDTLRFIRKTKASDALQHLTVLDSRSLRINPAVLSNAISLYPGDAYNQELSNLTYKRLMNLSITQSVHLTYSFVNATDVSAGGRQWLDCTIRIARNALNSLDLGTEGTNSGGSLGMGLNALFQNRNIFRGSETFRIKFTTGAELQGNIPSVVNERKFLIFNTFATSMETGIEFPRLVLPFRLPSAAPGVKPRTSLSAGIGFEARPDYTRTITTLACSYHWNSSERSRHIFTPLELNFVNISRDSAFSEYLNSLSDPQFLSQYTNHLLPMMRYSLIWNINTDSRLRNLSYFRLNLESSGSLLNLFDRITGARPDPEGYYSHFNVKYSQFLRTDADLRHYWPVRQKSTLAARLAFGIGMPFGNSVAMPFEKTFWLGGANDMRGWKIRSLGPGNYSTSEISYDRTGDLMLNANIEYRFPVYSVVKGALFMDAGNIWLRKNNPDFPGGTLKVEDFVKQLAMNTGAGLRFDFSFFILRIDWGLRIKNPALTNQWFNPEDIRLRQLVWNFGIGMPF